MGDGEVGSKLAPGKTEVAESWGTQAEAISHSFSRCLDSEFTVHQLWSCALMGNEHYPCP